MDHRGLPAPASMTSALLLRVGTMAPSVPDDAWVAPGAVVVGHVRLGPRSSVWYGAVLRGDEDLIEVGPGSNVQDNCVLHADAGVPTIVGADVTIGHNATVHGARVGDGSLIGMNAVLLNGCVIGAGSIIGAGAVVPEGARVPPRSLLMGVPAAARREVTDEEAVRSLATARAYQVRAERHRAATGMPKPRPAGSGGSAVVSK